MKLKSSPAGDMLQAPGYLLTILRIYLGIILLFTVTGKLLAATPFPAEMLDFINFEIKAGRPSGFYARFLQLVIIPIAGLTSYLVTTREVIAGFGLLLGAFTRLSALIAIMSFMNYMLAKGRWFWSPDSEDAAVFFIALVLFLGRAGRFFGLDGMLEKSGQSYFKVFFTYDFTAQGAHLLFIPFHIQKNKAGMRNAQSFARRCIKI